jgi:hypothetical protein
MISVDNGCVAVLYVAVAWRLNARLDRTEFQARHCLVRVMVGISIPQ